MKKLTDIVQDNVLNDAIDNCKAGRPSKALMRLYNIQNRSNVPWHLFPAWARPDMNTEGYHEG